MHGGIDPLVHDVAALLHAHRVRHKFPVLHLVPCHLEDEEAVGVVPWQEDVLDDVHDAVLPEFQGLGADDRRVAHVHSHGVSAVLVAHVGWVRVILQPLAHFLAVGGQDKAVADQVLEGRLVEDVRRKHHQRVKPSSRLVQALGDEVRGEALLELILVLEGVVLAAVWHGPALEPTVEDLVHALQHALALLRRDGDVVDEVAVEVCDFAARVLLQFRDAADANYLLEVVGDPEGDRRAPVAVPRDAPVAGLCQPIVEALLLDEARHPIGLVVVRDELVADFLDLDEPRGDRAVDEGRLGAPTMRVVVDLGAVEHQVPLLLQHLLDVLVGLLNVLPLEVRDIRREAAPLVHRVHHACPVLVDDAVLHADPVIVLSEGWGLVNDARARCSRNISVRQDLPVLAALRFRLLLEVRKQGLVGDADNLLAWHLLEDLEVLLRILLDGRANPIEPILAHDPLDAVRLLLHPQIGEGRVHAER
mmetsp:Transcript_63686/g.184702  ORF Transcript_63686/g.184702 Transcript_63686/m.184702 type:complete len:476 (-) Transcript_63686:842-2269(-)